MTFFQNLTRHFLVITLLVTPIFAGASLPAGTLAVGTIAPMLKIITPAVVNIAVEKELPKAAFVTPENYTQLPQILTGMGSGVIFNAEKGYIVTNAHVVDRAKIILVTLKDGRRFRGKLVGEDNGFDIAIIQIPAIKLQAIQFGDSSQLKVGDFVAAIGSPFGLNQTVTSGVISALNRSTPKIEGFQSFIQTDAPINPGNSGGALVNMQGQLIGINTALLGPNANIGIGFSIPSDMVQSVIDQLLKYGKVKRGILGVIAENITPSLADVFHIQQDDGTMVTQVLPGTPAETAGLKTEDVITKVNGKIIHSSEQLRNTLGLMPPGTKITLNVIRQEKPLTMEAIVGDPNAALKQRIIPFIDGMRLQNFTELQDDGELLKGVLITKISDLSDGALAGLNVGDVIISADQKPVKNITDLLNVITQKPKELLVKINRNNQDLFLVVNRQL